MHKPLIIFFSICTVASFTYGSFFLSLFLCFILLFFIYTGFFSSAIILSSLKGNLTLLKESSFSHLNNLLKENFKGFTDTLENQPELYVINRRKSLQIYILSESPLKIGVSQTLLEELSSNEIQNLLKSLKKNPQINFKKRLHLVSLSLCIGKFLKTLDALLCFILGLNSYNGEPRELTLKVFSPILNATSSLLSPLHVQEKQIKKSLLPEISYLDQRHAHPLLSPLSLFEIF